MKIINKIETMIEKWVKPLPHLPIKTQKTIADNLWWVVGIGIVISGIGLLIVFNTFLNGMSALMGAPGYGFYLTYIYTGWWASSIIVSMLALIITLIIMVKAFNPLKAMHRKGWDLLFLSLLVMVVAKVISFILNISISGLFRDLIFAFVGIVIGAYILFEIKSYFKVGKIAAVIEKK